MEKERGIPSPGRTVLLFGGLALAVLSVTALSLFTGGAPALPDVLRLRFARVVMGAAAGGGLGACGVILQALLRNPLAYPHILGISGGAAVGGILAQLFGFSAPVILGLHLPGAPLAAFVTALLTTLLVYRAASLGGRLEPVSLILVGVVFNSFAAALILFFFAVTDQREARGVLYWMIGSLDGIALSQVGWACAIVLGGCGLMHLLTPALNILSQGGEVAASLGVNVGRLRIAAFLGTSVVVGAVVSVCGMIGFVGLIVPHLFRLLLGPDHRFLFPASFLGGAFFLVGADYLARNAAYPRMIPVGVLTAFCGGPFFLFLLRRYHKKRYF